MQHNKLVRDKIIEYLDAQGIANKSHIADDAEYWEKLKQKLGEEVAEFCESESIEEFADVLEVLDAICDWKKFDPAEVTAVKERKAANKGAFKKRLILEESATT